MKKPAPRKINYSHFLSEKEVNSLIKNCKAHKFCDGIIWIKESNWDRKGPILVYDYSYIGEFYYFLRRGYFEETISSSLDPNDFSIFSGIDTSIDIPSDDKNGSKSNERRKDVVSSIPHILKILSRRKQATDIRMKQMRFVLK